MSPLQKPDIVPIPPSGIARSKAYALDLVFELSVLFVLSFYGMSAWKSTAYKSLFLESIN